LGYLPLFRRRGCNHSVTNRTRFGGTGPQVDHDTAKIGGSKQVCPEAIPVHTRVCVEFEFEYVATEGDYLGCLAVG
jgi:hypothetical protein